MPNWNGPNINLKGGAVGYGALGVNYTETNSSVLKQKLYNLLYNSYTNVNHPANTDGGKWDKMGASIVVRTMLGNKLNSPTRNRDRTISSTEWADLKARLVDNDDIVMKREWYSTTENVAGVYVNNSKGERVFDASRYVFDSQTNFDSWVFRSKSTNKIVYALELYCANPLGNLTGLPNPPVKNDKYDLKPTASIDKTVVEPGGSTTVTNSVKNEGVDPSAGTIWRLTEMIFSPGTTLNVNDKKGRDNELQPCDSGTGAFPGGSGRTSCKTSPAQDKTNIVFNPGNPLVSSYTYNVPTDTAVGTKICFTVSVSKPTQAASPLWRHSDLQCIIVAKKPKVQVWGGDVRAGGTISTSTNTLDGKTYGSWGEYGALSNGSNSGFASGNGLNSGNTNSAQSGWSGLTFANTGGTCTFGCYNFTLTSRSLTDQFGTGNALPNGGDINSWPNGTYTTNGLTLSGITINKGKSIVIISTGTVTIAGNIAYNDGPYTSLKDIPQLVIRAPVINIQGGVGRVDAWLFAINATNSGVLNTCSDVGVDDKLTANICNSTLAVNGPVVADKLYLRRTAGSDGSEPTRGKPAETFNLRADAYLWGSGYTNGKGKVRTVYTKELAPRF